MQHFRATDMNKDGFVSMSEIDEAYKYRMSLFSDAEIFAKLDTVLAYDMA